MSTPADTAAPCLAALARLAGELVGHRLFTVMVLDEEARLARRAYSNMPDAYPVAGAKPLQMDAWHAQVVERRQLFVANDAAALAAVFDDHELIATLGCASVLNLPVQDGDTVLGTLNLLHEAGHYTPERVAAARLLHAPAAACLRHIAILRMGTG